MSLEEARSHTREKESLLEEQRRKERELLTTVTRYAHSLTHSLAPGFRTL